MHLRNIPVLYFIRRILLKELAPVSVSAAIKTELDVLPITSVGLTFRCATRRVCSSAGELDDSRPYIKAGRKHRIAPYKELLDVRHLDDEGFGIDR
jgi:hypothetical protein